MSILKLCMEELSVRLVQHHSSQGAMLLVTLLISCLLIFVHELRAIQRNVRIQPFLQAEPFPE